MFMTTIEEMQKIENKYKKMGDGATILAKKVNESDIIRTMTNNFRFLMAKKNVSALDSSIFSDIFGCSLIMFEEALEKERKERFFEFVSSVFSKENLKGEEEKFLYEKMLRRIENKMNKKKK